jgi:bacillithiol system protein YtxJ
MSSLNWTRLSSVEQFDELLEKSRTKPALVYKYRSNSPESLSIKKQLEEEWSIGRDMIDLYDLDEVSDPDVCNEVTINAGVDDEFPQVLLFADGVTMYDESHEMINVKKIKIALKIINRTFKWMESRA